MLEWYLEICFGEVSLDNIFPLADLTKSGVDVRHQAWRRL
jgi:hypothetical protein